jgi:hypothetical protein
MATSDDSSNSVLSETNADQLHEYYEELDHQTLDFRKRKISTSISAISFVTEVPPVVDPVKKLNEKLNRQFRPDLVCYKLNLFFFFSYY